MNIQSISFNTYYNIPQIQQIKHNAVSNPVHINSTLPCDCVSFSGVSHGGDILKKLSAYGIPDMYTGQILLNPKIIEKWQNKGVFDYPIGRLTEIISNYEHSLMPIDKQFFHIIKGIAKTSPDLTLSEATKELYPKHKKLLLRAQQPIFEGIIRLACDLPKDLYEEFSELMNITNKRLLNDPVVLPFSEREFLYKLKRIGDNITIKGNKNEIHAINKLIKSARAIFNSEQRGQKIFGKKIKQKLETQMLPENLKRNSTNFAKFKEIFENSQLRKNEYIIRLLENTSAKIHGFPSYAQFERKSFIHELKKITRKLKNRKFAQEFTELSLKLPTSKDNVSAFIVKYAEENNNKIGTNMLIGASCSVDHLLAKKNGGASKLANYGLTSAETNRQKTNIYFDKWLKIHPETRQNCQKYVDRLIELYKQGIFEKISKEENKHKRLDKSYIEDFAATIFDMSPENNRIILDISKLYE